jgi:DnaK suppressor protein
MNKELAAAFKLQLLEQRKDLLEQLARLRGGEVGRAQASEEHFAEAEDSRAQLATDRELEFALDEHESASLSLIDAALKRLDAGVYGECMECGKAIPLERLRATPQALRCVACQDNFERTGTRSTF